MGLAPQISGAHTALSCGLRIISQKDVESGVGLQTGEFAVMAAFQENEWEEDKKHSGNETGRCYPFFPEKKNAGEQKQKSCHHPVGQKCKGRKNARSGTVKDAGKIFLCFRFVQKDKDRRCQRQEERFRYKFRRVEYQRGKNH